MIGIIIFGSIALIFGIMIVILETRINKKDHRLEKVLSVLPGYNCGACGFPGCEALAREILNDAENTLKCKPMKDKETKKRIVEEILG